MLMSSNKHNQVMDFLNHIIHWEFGKLKILRKGGQGSSYNRSRLKILEK